MAKFKVTIKGVSSLLMNRPPAYIIDPSVDSNISIKNPNIDKEKEIKDKIYSNNGVIYQPATHIRGAMINAAKDFKVRGKGKSNYSKMFAAMVEIVPEVIPHKLLDFDVLVVRTVNPTTKGMNMTRRPRLKEWEIDFEINAEDEIPSDVIKEVLDRAGKYVGIGDWRPATKGTNGKFQVVSFKEVK